MRNQQYKTSAMRADDLATHHQKLLIADVMDSLIVGLILALCYIVAVESGVGIVADVLYFAVTALLIAVKLFFGKHPKGKV